MKIKKFNISTRFIAAILFGFLFHSCIDKYDFNVNKSGKGLVVEASISNISFQESNGIPADASFFRVVLSQTSDVDNIRDVKVSDAVVTLKDSDSNTWRYSGAGNGEYFLKNEIFKAEEDKAYQLNIDLKTGEHFESAWEKMPGLKNEIGDFSMKEVSPEEYVYQAGEPVIRSIDGIKIFINVPARTDAQTYRYKWSFQPLWMYTSELASVVNSQQIVCWVRNNFYLRDYVLMTDKRGGFNKELFFVQTQGNERVYQYFSVLVNQDVVSEGYYQFWKDLDAQKNKGGLYDQPPFGLGSNIVSTNNDWTVNGYFGVVNRKSKRWTFKPEDLSYAVKNNLEELCLLLNNEPGPKEGQCYYCTQYNQGDATTTPPLWW